MAYPEFEKPVSEDTLRKITAMKIALQHAADEALIARASISSVRRRMELDSCGKHLGRARELLEQINRDLGGVEPPSKLSLRVIEGGAA